MQMDGRGLSTDGRDLSMDNRGMSLVEIVIVVTIMTVLTGIMAVGVSMALSKPADECAEKIVSTLNGARITTMGKQGITLRFYMDDQSVWLEEVITNSDGTLAAPKKTKIGQKGVKVEYMLEGDTSYQTLDSSGITLSFKRSTGGFNPVSGSSYCKAIKVSKGSGNSYREKIITLAYLTGKVTID